MSRHSDAGGLDRRRECPHLGPQYSIGNEGGEVLAAMNDESLLLTFSHVVEVLAATKRPCAREGACWRVGDQDRGGDSDGRT